MDTSTPAGEQAACLEFKNDWPARIDTSIVIATCNRAALLRDALYSLLRQDWADEHAVELVVVDDGSTDGTAELLEAMARRVRLPLRIVAGPKQGIAAARNAGCAAARGRWLASFDDDQLADPGWLRALRERADCEGALCVGGALRLLLPEGHAGRPGRRVETVLGQHLPYARPRPYGRKIHPATNNALLRRDAYLSLGGFDTRFTEGGEDKEFFRRLKATGHPIRYEPDARVGHVTPPARLARSNLRWTSLRLGAADARMALAAGGLAALGLSVSRAAVAVGRDAPRWLLAGERRRMDALCSLWYTEGVLRGVTALRRRSRNGERFLSSMNFRRRNGERESVHGSG